MNSNSYRGKDRTYSKRAAPCFQMYPSLHQPVASTLASHAIPIQFHNANSDEGTVNRYSTFVMGSFACENNVCPGGVWLSGKITILIRKYPGNEYNAVVYKQRCRYCKRLGRLDLDEQSYTDRVAYRLMKWAGMELDRPAHGGKTTKPHRSDLCEGCKRGVCEEGNRQDIL